MDIILGKKAGFCYGVKRAVQESERLTKENVKIYCLGELVHNKQVVESLKKEGLTFIEKLKEINEKNSKVIIRAHGVEKSIYLEAKEKNIEVVDNTCPNVLKIHKLAEDYRKNGYFILLTGTRNHPEIKGTISYCGDKLFLIEEENDIENAIETLEKSKIEKVLLISQTTYSTKKFAKIQKTLTNKLKEKYKLVVKNTICLATELRQKETEELSKKVEMMIIIGGKNSSNTKKLFEIAKTNCKNTICIETKEEINKILLQGISRVGVMAGASTPQNSIDEVINMIK